MGDTRQLTQFRSCGLVITALIADPKTTGLLDQTGYGSLGNTSIYEARIANVRDARYTQFLGLWALRKDKDSGMRFTETGVVGACVIDPNPHGDDRGRFLRAWCAREFAEHGLEFLPVQANMGFSVLKGTVRGMHFQEAPALEAKLVRCTRGAIFDVVVDLRPASSSYGKWYGIELSAENGRMLHVPELCAHGYQTLEDCTEMYYMTSAFYTPSAVRGVRFDDAAFSIQWPLVATVVSEQDRSWPLVGR